jgi:hypothetical protein
MTKNSPTAVAACSLALLLLAAAFVDPPFVTAEDHHPYKTGLLLEDNFEFPCSHECGPFEPMYVSFCVEDGAEIILGRLFDTRFNYDPNKLRPFIGKSIKFRSDADSLWIVRPDGQSFT